MEETLMAWTNHRSPLDDIPVLDPEADGPSKRCVEGTPLGVH